MPPRVLALTLACWAIVLIAPGSAAAQSATARPRSINLALSSIPPTLQVRWVLDDGGGVEDCVSDPNDDICFPVIVSGNFDSDGGQIQTAGPAPQLLSTLPPLTGVGGTFPETVSLPVSRIEALAATGVRRLVLLRRFQLGLSDFVAAVPINLTSSLGSTFQLTRVGLRFPNGAPLRIVSQYSALEVFADVSYGGRGEIRAIWEVADPTTTAGAPVFRPLRRVRRLLSGGQRTSLRSPPLPTTLTGLHLVRLRVTRPGAAFELPVLRYFVAEEDVPVDPVAVTLLDPVHEATLQPDTVFRWAPVRGAKAYRLELHAASAFPPGRHFRFDPGHPGYAETQGLADSKSAYEGDTQPGDDPGLVAPGFERRPTAGRMVGGDRTEAELGAAARHLEPGGTYLWVVRALGEGGVALGLSPTRVIRVPKRIAE